VADDENDDIDDLSHDNPVPGIFLLSYTPGRFQQIDPIFSPDISARQGSSNAPGRW